MAERLIRVSVRELVSVVLRSGDLERGGFVSSGRLVAGTRAHQRVQRSRPAEYQAEVPVTHLEENGSLLLEISGRVDGLIKEPDNLVLEEIKTTEGELDPGVVENPVHWAQAKVYAWIVGTQAGREWIDVRLTYVRLEPFATLELEERFELSALGSFFNDMVEQYLHRAREYCAWCDQRDASIIALRFPFLQSRPGQQELVEAVREAIMDQGRLFVQAPTGIGKTVSVLFPAVQSLASGDVDKIFYLTPKTVVRTAAEKAVDDLRGVGLRLRSLTLTARERICLQAEGRSRCDPLSCPYAQGYYDRIHQALEEGLAQEALTRSVIESLARRHQVCPFEYSLELALWSDLIICDYNYVFDPRAYLRRFFADGSGRYVFLVDEAHNLVDRGRTMFSADLRKAGVLALKRRLGQGQQELRQQLDRINQEMLELGNWSDGETGTCVTLEQPPDELLPLLQGFVTRAEPVLARHPGGSMWEALLDFYFLVIAFLRVDELYADDYVTYVERNGRDVCVRLFCLDPARNLREALRRGQTAVFFSATLTPLQYFRDLLGGRPEDGQLELDSPFPTENLHVMVADDIATTFKQRSATCRQVAAAIEAMVAVRPGNYMAFFPSYQYLEAVVRRFQAPGPGVRIVVQTPAMAEGEREAFLSVFAAEHNETVIGFAVMGGLFGEGIDLMGDRLVGAAIVGVGLPQLSPERDLIRAYFDEAGSSGFDYAYTFPGMNRVLQAAGRVIRSESDRGLVLLIDQRFGQSRYERLFPRCWRPLYRTRTPEQIRSSLHAFWNGIRELRYEPLDEPLES